MKNVEITQEGHILTVKMDLSQDFGRSGSGKTIIIATSAGNQQVATDADGKPIFLGITVYKK